MDYDAVWLERHFATPVVSNCGNRQRGHGRKDDSKAPKCLRLSFHIVFSFEPTGVNGQA